MEIRAPRNQALLFGQEAAEQAFLNARRSGRLPHAWIFSGPRGIGKATLAYRLARMALAESDEPLAENHPVFRRVAGGSHADLLVIEPAFDEKKEEARQEITVDEVRRVGAFFSMTPAESAWRVVIVDSADALNVNAANALLKLLEEPPPNSLLLLIAHNPGGLLPTIRSRCRSLRLKPLSEEAFDAVLRREAPELPPEETAMLKALSAGSPGAALSLLEAEGTALYSQARALLSEWPRVDAKRLLAFTKSLQSPPVHARRRAAAEAILRLLALAASGDEPELPGENECVAALLKQATPREWASRYQAAEQWFTAAARAHLDNFAVMTAFFEGQTLNNMEQVE